MILDSIFEGVKLDKRAISYIENSNDILMGIELEFKDTDNTLYQLINDDMEFDTLEELVHYLNVHPDFDLTKFKEELKDIASKEETTVKDLMENPEKIVSWLSFIPMYGNTHNLGYLYLVKEYIESLDVIVSNVSTSVTNVNSDWALEYDSDLIEVKSAPMTFKRVTTDLIKIIKMIAHSPNFTIDSECGLHINISMKGKNTEDIDWVKFLLFLDEEYFLKHFDRIDNHNTQQIITKGQDDYNKLVKQYMNSYKSHSLNFRGNYMEVRIAGGVKIITDLPSVLRYIRQVAYAMVIAADENAFKNEYYKKLSKLSS